MADVTRKTGRPDHETRAAEDPAAKAAGVAGRAAVKEPAKAGESDPKTILILLRFNR